MYKVEIKAPKIIFINWWVINGLPLNIPLKVRDIEVSSLVIYVILVVKATNITSTIVVITEKIIMPLFFEYRLATNFKYTGKILKYK